MTRLSRSSGARGAATSWIFGRSRRAAALADPAFFVDAMAVEDGGYGLVWPRPPTADDEVGGIDISADSLWYRAHPEEWRKDYGPLDSAAD